MARRCPGFLPNSPARKNLLGKKDISTFFLPGRKPRESGGKIFFQDHSSTTIDRLESVREEESADILIVFVVESRSMLQYDNRPAREREGRGERRRFNCFRNFPIISQEWLLEV